MLMVDGYYKIAFGMHLMMINEKCQKIANDELFVWFLFDKSGDQVAKKINCIQW